MKILAPDGDEPRVYLPDDVVAFLLDRPEPPLFNAYTCDTCGGVMVTVDVHRGVTPMFLRCRRTPGCEGAAKSAMYPGGGRELPAYLEDEPRWEWYRPRRREFRRMSGEMRDHIERGGLALREARR